MARHHLVDESGNLDAAQRVHHDFPGLDDRVHPNRVEHEDKEATYLRGTPSGFAPRRGQARAHRSGVAGPARAVQGWVGGEGGAGGCGRAHRRRRSTLALDPHVCWLRLVPPRVHPTEHVQVRAAHPQRRPSGAWWQWRSPALHSRRGSSARRDGSTRMPVRTL